MVRYNTEFYWMSTLQNQSIFWTRLLPCLKYRLLLLSRTKYSLQGTHPTKLSIVSKYMYVKQELSLTDYAPRTGLFLGKLRLLENGW